MADPFESPGAAGHDGFKLFGKSVADFSATVAGASAISKEIGRQVAIAMEQQAKAATTGAASSKTFDEGVKATADAASKMQAAGTKMQDAAKRQLAANQVQLSWWDKMKGAIKEWKENDEKNPLLKSVGSLTGAFKGILPLLKDFVMKFAVVFIPLQLVARILSRFMEQTDTQRMILRELGMGSADKFNALQASGIGAASAAQRIFGRSAMAIGPTQLKDLMVSINSELKNSDKLTSELVGSAFGISKAFNVALDTSGKFYGFLARTTKISENEINDLFGLANKVATDLKINVSEFINELAAAPEMALDFGVNMRKGRLELIRARAEAKLLGTTFEQARTFADSLFDVSNMVEVAATARAQGLNISMQDLSRGAFEQGGASALAVKFASQIRQQRGALTASGADRFELSQILQSVPGLQQLFGDEGGLAKAIAAVGEGGRLSDIDKILEEASKTDQEKLLGAVGDLAAKGGSIEDRLNDFADTLVDTLVKSKIGLMLGAMLSNLIDMNPKAEIAKAANSWWGDLGRKVADANAPDPQAIATAEFIRGQSAAGTGVMSDGILEISELIQILRSVNTAKEDVPKMAMDIIRNLLRDPEFQISRRDDMHRLQKVTLTNIKSEVIGDMMMTWE